MGRTRSFQKISDWRSKMRPVFFELADVNQQFEKRWSKIERECKQGLETAAGTDAPEIKKRVIEYFRRRVSELSRETDEKLIDIDKRYKPFSFNPLAFSYLTLDPPSPDAEGIFEWLHFQRHGEGFWTTAMKDANGEDGAWDRISRTEKDFRIAVLGQGAIKPFRFDVEHRQLLELIICFEEQRLTAEELAHCVDCYCGCCTEHHEANTLKRLRARLEADLRTGMVEATDS
jgi:hypothetical protein